MFEHVKEDAQMTTQNISTAIMTLEELFDMAADEGTATDYAVAIKALQLAERLKELADA